MNIIYKNPKNLKSYENNPRDNTSGINPVMESIKQFGFLVPILLSKDDEIIAGHTRKEAAICLDLQEVPCLYADNLSEEQVKAFRLVDNRTSEFSSWNFDKLQIELKDLENITNIDLSGFKFPNFDEELDVLDEEFLQDEENIKEEKQKTIKCPNCGMVIVL